MQTKILLTQEFMLFGGGNTEFWHDVFIPSSKDLNHVCKCRRTNINKIFKKQFSCNLKVVFFNEVYDFCNMTNLNYEKISELVGIDKRITKVSCRFP